MGYLVAIAMILLGIFKPKSKAVTVAIGLFMVVAIGLNIKTADYESYKTMFLECMNPVYNGHEPGYMLLCKLLFSLGFSYTMFRIVVALLITILLCKGVGYLTENINYALAMYLIFSFAGNASGLRFSLGAAVVMYASRYLFQESKWAPVKYVAGVLIAFTFHYTMVFYLLMLAVYIRKLKVAVVGWITGVVTVTGAVAMSTGILGDILRMFTSNYKVLQWFHGEGFFTELYLVVVLILLAVFALLIIAREVFRLDSRKGKLGNGVMERAQACDVILKLGILCMVSFAGVFFGGVVFMRLLMVFIPYYYAILAEAIFLELPKKEIRIMGIQVPFLQKGLRFLIPVFCAGVALFIYGFWIGGDFLHVYQNNMLFGF